MPMLHWDEEDLAWGQDAGQEGGLSKPEQSSLSGKESAQGCLPKRLLGRPD